MLAAGIVLLFPLFLFTSLFRPTIQIWLKLDSRERQLKLSWVYSAPKRSRLFGTVCYVQNVWCYFLLSLLECLPPSSFQYAAVKRISFLFSSVSPSRYAELYASVVVREHAFHSYCLVRLLDTYFHVHHSM